MGKKTLPIIAGFLVAAAVSIFLLRRSEPEQMPVTDQEVAAETIVVESDVQVNARSPDKRNQPSEVEPEEPYTPPSVEDQALALLVNRNATSGRVTGDITHRLPRIKHQQDVQVVVTVLYDTRDNDTVRNEAAKLLSRSNYSDLTNDLINILNDPNEGSRFRSWCIQHLWLNWRKADEDEKDKIKKTILETLNDRDIPVRRESLLALSRMKEPVAKDTALKWFKEDGLKDIAIRIVRENDMRDQISVLREFLNDDDQSARIAAMVTLSGWGDEQNQNGARLFQRSDVGWCRSRV